MKTKTWVNRFIESVFLCCCSLGVQAEAQIIPSIPRPLPAVEFVGVTTATVKPGYDETGSQRAGIFALSRACQAQFRQSHVCSSADILRSARTPVFPEGVEGAWVNPSIVSMLSDLKFDSWGHVSHLLVDASGKVMRSTGDPNDGLNCGQWGTEYAVGLAVNGSGAFDTMACTVARPVACCIATAGR